MACRDIDQALRAVKLSPHQRLVVTLIRQWAERTLIDWDGQPDKKDWRKDDPPRCPVRDLVEQARAIRDPEKYDAVPFLDEGMESTMAFFGEPYDD